ncbi:MAG: Ger(x)C family spore germination protein [Lysinibacillus sp.]
MKKLKVLALILASFTLLAGCAEQHILERLSLATLIGYDAGDEEYDLSSTFVIRQVNPEFQSDVITLSAVAKTTKGIRDEIGLQVSKKVAKGQLRVVLYGEEFAKAGIGQMIYNQLKNPEVSSGVYLSVVEGKTKPFLEYQYDNITDIGQHIYNLLGHNIERERLLSSTIHETGRDYYSPTRQIILPIIKRKENLVEITGLALFRNDQMVGRLPAEDIFYVKLLREGYENGSVELLLDGKNLESLIAPKREVPDKIAVAFDSIKADMKMKVVNQTTPEFDVNIEIKLRLTDIDDAIQMNRKNTNELIQEEVNKKMEKELYRIIEYSQELNSDVFGFGEYYKSRVRDANLTPEKEENMYPNMKMNIHIHSKIIRNGVFGVE